VPAHGDGGLDMLSIHRLVRLLPAMAVLLFAWGAVAQSFRVQCPTNTTLHQPLTDGTSNPGIKCQQISGGTASRRWATARRPICSASGRCRASPISSKVCRARSRVGVQRRQQPQPANIGDPQPGYVFNGAIGLVPDPESVPANQLTGHVDPRLIMDVGVMNANQPAPLFAIDEDDEFFLTLTNVGQIMRPDLFEQHTVHFHGYPTPPRSTTAFPTPPSPSTSAAALPTITSRPRREPTSGIATFRRPSTCRWAWWGRSTCGRARIE